MVSIYLDLEGTFLAGKRNKTEGTFLAGKRNKTEGAFLAGKRNFQGTSQPLRDCVNSFSPAAPAEAMPKFFLHILHVCMYVCMLTEGGTRPSVVPSTYF